MPAKKSKSKKMSFSSDVGAARLAQADKMKGFKNAGKGLTSRKSFK